MVNVLADPPDKLSGYCHIGHLKPTLVPVDSMFSSGFHSICTYVHLHVDTPAHNSKQVNSV